MECYTHHTVDCAKRESLIKKVKNIGKKIVAGGLITVSLFFSRPLLAEELKEDVSESFVVTTRFNEFLESHYYVVRNKQARKGRMLAVIVTGLKDWNGALNNTTTERALYKRGYDLLIFEPKNGTELMKFFKWFVDNMKQRADVLLFKIHGSPDLLWGLESLNEFIDLIEKGFCDEDTKKKLKENILEENGKIIFSSCSTGADFEDGIARKISYIFERNTFAPDKNITGMILDFDNDNRITDIKYLGVDGEDVATVFFRPTITDSTTQICFYREETEHKMCFKFVPTQKKDSDRFLLFSRLIYSPLISYNVYNYDIKNTLSVSSLDKKTLLTLSSGNLGIHVNNTTLLYPLGGIIEEADVGSLKNLVLKYLVHDLHDINLVYYFFNSPFSKHVRGGIGGGVSLKSTTIGITENGISNTKGDIIDDTYPFYGIPPFNLYDILFIAIPLKHLSEGRSTYEYVGNILFPVRIGEFSVSSGFSTDVGALFSVDYTSNFYVRLSFKKTDTETYVGGWFKKGERTLKDFFNIHFKSYQLAASYYENNLIKHISLDGEFGLALIDLIAGFGLIQNNNSYSVREFSIGPNIGGISFVFKYSNVYSAYHLLNDMKFNEYAFGVSLDLQKYLHLNLLTLPTDDTKY